MKRIIFFAHFPLGGQVTNCILISRPAGKHSILHHISCKPPHAVARLASEEKQNYHGNSSHRDCYVFISTHRE